MIPTKAQWEKWSLPSKYSAIGILIGIISLLPLFISIIYNQSDITATEYTNNTQWYLDVKSTAENMPEKFKQLFDDDETFKKQLIIAAKESFGVDSNEYKVVTTILHDGKNSIEAMLLLSKVKLVITDKSVTLFTGIDLKEMHNKAIADLKNNECTGSSIEFKSVSGDITKVTKNGIEFKIPSQTFTEYSGCNSNKVAVDYLPATAQLVGKKLIVTHKEGIRIVEELNGKKTIVRKDVNLIFNSKPGRQD